MEKKLKITKFSLGLEELALALGLVTYKDLARNLLTSLYDNHSPEQLDAQLISAGHSLLARGYTTLSESGSATLIPELEKAIFSLGKFDYVLEFSIYRNNKQVQSTIRVQKEGLFTSQMVNQDVVYVLESGNTKDLQPFILNALEGFASQNDIGRDTSFPIDLGTLGKALNFFAKGADVKPLFSAAGWSRKDVEMISIDFTSQIIRGAIIRVDAASSTKIENFADSKRSSLLFLRSKHNSWVFLFDSIEDNSIGVAIIVDQKRFSDILNEMIYQ